MPNPFEPKTDLDKFSDNLAECRKQLLRSISRDLKPVVERINNLIKKNQ